MNKETLQTITDVKQTYDSIVVGAGREPISIFLKKNDEQLTKLVVALNKMVVAIDLESFADHSKNITKARRAILEDLKTRYASGDKMVKPNSQWSSPYGEEDKGTNYFSGSGEMKCPICEDGKLRYSRSGYNGHVHAACTKNTCVRWME
jgi:hypothetical protein